MFKDSLENGASNSTEHQLIACWDVSATAQTITRTLEPEWDGRDGGPATSERNRLGYLLSTYGVARPSDTASSLLAYGSLDPDNPEHLAFIKKLHLDKDKRALVIWNAMLRIYSICVFSSDEDRDTNLGPKLAGRVAPWLVLLEQELPKLLAEKPHALLIATRCPVLCQAYQTGGAGQGEPLWFAVLRIVAHCEPSIAIEVSDGHEKYTHAELEARLERIAREQLKPSTCKYISDFSPLCSGCEWRGIIKSPIALGYANPPKKRGAAQ